MCNAPAVHESRIFREEAEGRRTRNRYRLQYSGSSRRSPEPSTPPPRLAVICHLFYPALTSEFQRYLRNIPFSFDTFVSTDMLAKQAAIARRFSHWKHGAVDMRVTINRGRDIAPKLITFRDVYDRYDYVLHLHSKRSKHAPDLKYWRSFLLENLLGSVDIVTSIFEIFRCRPDVGLIASQHFEPVRHLINWGANFELAQGLAKRMGIDLSSDGVLDFPSGSMFWARSRALKQLLDLALTVEDFAPECDQKDGTLAHALERLYFFACERAGFHWIKVSDPTLFAHTPTIIPIEHPAALEGFMSEYQMRLTGSANVAPCLAQPIPIVQPSRDSCRVSTDGDPAGFPSHRTVSLLMLSSGAPKLGAELARLGRSAAASCRLEFAGRSMSKTTVTFCFP